ncbi:hypothetical protein QBC36DRAFT_331169 [Triangularia setosa]|uniref:Uncharacterized protein n=1 Tax=Triangularia setosa TaxID=2587417 RepID=A0AAN7A680_9PEZI|nr:hypothetical protein QBC36DRAFT_331169 [Podospora setosa]
MIYHFLLLFVSKQLGSFYFCCKKTMAGAWGMEIRGHVMLLFSLSFSFCLLYTTIFLTATPKARELGMDGGGKIVRRPGRQERRRESATYFRYPLCIQAIIIFFPIFFMVSPPPPALYCLFHVSRGGGGSLVWNVFIDMNMLVALYQYH